MYHCFFLAPLDAPNVFGSSFLGRGIEWSCTLTTITIGTSIGDLELLLVIASR